MSEGCDGARGDISEGAKGEKLDSQVYKSMNCCTRRRLGSAARTWKVNGSSLMGEELGWWRLLRRNRARFRHN